MDPGCACLQSQLCLDIRSGLQYGSNHHRRETRLVAQAVKPGATTQTTIVGGVPAAVGQRLVAPPGLFDIVAWRDAAVAWLAQRLILWTLTCLTLWQLLPQRSATAPLSLLWTRFLHVWTTWDGAIYASISQGGYTQLQNTAFFPLYPLLERLLAPVFGGDPVLAGLFTSNVACLVAFAWLRVLAEREYGRMVARRTLLYLAIFPYALFLAAAYTEGLFLALSLATFLALRGHNWKLAGICAALATLTRPVGILLLLPLMYEYVVSQVRSPGTWRGKLRVDVVIALSLPVLALLGFNLALAPRFGTLLPTTTAQSRFWGRRLSWPWDGLLRAAHAVLHAPLGIGAYVTLDIVWTLLFTVLALALLWPFGPLRSSDGSRLPVAYGLYALATVVLILLTPMNKPGFEWATLASNGRFMLVVFPLFLLLARASSVRPWLHHLILAVSLVYGLLLAVIWIHGGFVA
jgi:Gpi18-like mannosyltransferase